MSLPDQVDAIAGWTRLYAAKAPQYCFLCFRNVGSILAGTSCLSSKDSMSSIVLRGIVCVIHARVRERLVRLASERDTLEARLAEYELACSFTA